MGSQLGGESVELVLPLLPHGVVVRDGAVDAGAATALVPARLLTPLGEVLERRVRVGDGRCGSLDLIEQQGPELVSDDAVQGEVLGATLVEHSRDAVRDVRIAQWLWRLIQEGRSCGDVEASRVAVAGKGGVAPFAVELVGAEHERAVDGGALGAMGGTRVTVLEL